MPWYKLEKSPTLEALERFEKAHGMTFCALMNALTFGTMGLMYPHDPRMLSARIGLCAVLAVSLLPQYVVAMLRAWDRPGRWRWVAGLVAHLTWVGLGMASGPKVGLGTVFLVVAAAAYIEDMVRDRAGRDDATRVAGEEQARDGC